MCVHQQVLLKKKEKLPPYQESDHFLGWKKWNTHKWYNETERERKFQPGSGSSYCRVLYYDSRRLRWLGNLCDAFWQLLERSRNEGGTGVELEIAFRIILAWVSRFLLVIESLSNRTASSAAHTGSSGFLWKQFSFEIIRNDRPGASLQVVLIAANVKRNQAKLKITKLLRY